MDERQPVVDISDVVEKAYLRVLSAILRWVRSEGRSLCHADRCSILTIMIDGHSSFRSGLVTGGILQEYTGGACWHTVAAESLLGNETPN